MRAQSLPKLRANVRQTSPTLTALTIFLSPHQFVTCGRIRDPTHKVCTEHRQQTPAELWAQDRQTCGPMVHRGRPGIIRLSVNSQNPASHRGHNHSLGTGRRNRKKSRRIQCLSRRVLALTRVCCLPSRPELLVWSWGWWHSIICLIILKAAILSIVISGRLARSTGRVC